MASIPKSAWVQLYKQLQRSAAKFPQYEYREFFKRRIRDHFAAAIANKDISKEEFYNKEKELLAVIRRQVVINQLYPTPKLVIEDEEYKKNKKAR